jgi:NitT/TauT family transport system permease protein
MLYDQLIFRPLNYWLSKQNDSEGVLRPNRLWQIILQSSLVYAFIGVLRLCKRVVEKTQSTLPSFKPVRRASSKLPMLLLLALSIYAVLEFISYLYVARSILSISDVIETITLGGFTALRVFVLVLLCCLIWVPVGVYLGMNERVSDIMQPIIQFLAAFPPNMLYPLVAAFIIGKGYNPNIWLSPLMVLGTQWYILFNVIAGVRALPKELLLMAKSFNLSGLALYKRVILPGMLPSLLTGVITAAGGAWNASIIAEVADWQGEVVYAKGLGAYIMYASRNADTHLVYLGVIVMCIYVLVINRLVWLPLYRLIEKKYGGGK